jgi:hypothetical protein
LQRGLTEDELTVDGGKVFGKEPVEGIGLACRRFDDLPTHHESIIVSLLELFQLLSRVGM